MAWGGQHEFLDLHHPLRASLRRTSVLVEAVPVVVALFDAILDGAHLQRKGGPNPVGLFHEDAHGVVVVVCSAGHVRERDVAMVEQPLDRTGIPFGSATKGHQFREALLLQPLPGRLLVVHGMDKKSEFRKAISQQPIAELTVA